MPIPEEVPQSSAVQKQPAQCLLLAIWFGLLTGIAEVVVFALRPFLVQRFIGVGPDIIWMAPVTAERYQPFGWSHQQAPAIAEHGTTVAGLALGVHAWQAFTEYRALVKLPQASANLPNVLLIVLDTVRAGNLMPYGYARRTSPQLQRIAAAGRANSREDPAPSMTTLFPQRGAAIRT
jgi:hypothetical protein